MTLSSAVPGHLGTALGGTKFKMGHMTLTTSNLRVICHPYVGSWHSLPGDGSKC